MPDPTNFRAGFAILVGRTNVGKSTLLNALVGTKIAIVTPRPQTTRDTYHGIVHRPGGQIVFVDTPGLFKTAPSRLVSNLHHKVRDALEGIDVLLHVVDPSRPVGPEDRRVMEMVAQATKPKVLCLNKSDLSRRPFRHQWLAQAQAPTAVGAPPKYAAVFEVSGLRGTGIDLLIETVLGLLPVGPAQYPDGQVTNVTNEFWLAELIREKVYLLTGDEVPYTASVQVEQIEDRKDKTGQPLVYIKAAILTIDDRHQRMLIGAGGRKVREIGSAARHELEGAMNRKVFLDLTVVIDDQWMDRME